MITNNVLTNNMLTVKAFERLLKEIKKINDVFTLSFSLIEILNNHNLYKYWIDASEYAAIQYPSRNDDNLFLECRLEKFKQCVLENTLCL